MPQLPELSPAVRQLAAALRPALQLGEGPEVTLEVLKLAGNRHRVAALLHHAVVQSGRETDPHLAQVLADDARRDLRQVLQLKSATMRLHRLLDEHAIPHVEIKGWQLGEMLYGGAALRHSKDVDVLVDPARIADAIDLAAANGYLARGGGPLEAGRSRAILHFHRETAIRDPQLGVEIELHSRPLADPPPGWDDRVFLDGPLDLGSADYVLYLILHGAGTRWNRLKWLCDLLMIARKTSPQVREQVVSRAREFDCLPAVAASFLTLAGLWDDDAIRDWIGQIGLTADDRRTARHLAENAAALNRNGPLPFATLMARRVELVRDAPLFGERAPSRLRAMADRSVLWFLRRGE